MSNITYKICPYCGAHMVRRKNVMTTSQPALYIYDCPECGNAEYDIHMYPCGDDTDGLVHSEIVDYKKLYEEALDRAKEKRNEYLRLDKDNVVPTDIETIFPELREDEDERIRKCIVETIKQCPDTFLNPKNRDKMIAYLEKQKDSIPYEKYVEDIAAIHAEARTKYHAGWNDGYEAKQKAQKCDAREFTIYHPLKNGKGEYECIPYSFYGSLTSFSEDKDLIDFLHTCFYTEEECNEWIEHQKEQKPISTEDMPYITNEHFWKREPADSFRYKLAEYMTKNCRKEESPDGYTYHISAESILKMAEEELIKRGVVQKPAECLKAERDGWYICIKDYYRGGKKQSSVGDLIQAKGGMYMMGEEDISEWFRRAYYEEVRDAFRPNTDTNIPEQFAE